LLFGLDEQQPWVGVLASLRGNFTFLRRRNSHGNFTFCAETSLFGLMSSLLVLVVAMFTGVGVQWAIIAMDGVVGFIMSFH
jgi:hypothetical protein